MKATISSTISRLAQENELQSDGHDATSPRQLEDVVHQKHSSALHRSLEE